ncbi:CBS domain-containing protein [Nitrospirillum sp. BR 11164]|uniref:CBS domain-containing protein n=1 Tax=Nitrospirillum sp. BR 11164 TaxID=3104324 RepID=UPI002AFDDD65|nr:CBS domain-containing protein [Nitrospirillum sp. BR 11164]MEA1650928.1 CBS domain-containing protein [Nitrospirillum sp. BR 11164]
MAAPAPTLEIFKPTAVRQIMTPGVLTVRPDTPLVDALRLMVRNRISGLPVVEDDAAADGGGCRVVGVLTEGDLMRRAETGTEVHDRWWQRMFTTPGDQADQYSKVHGRRVDEVMTRDVLTVDVDDDIATAVALMDGRKVKRLPVLAHGHLAGVISRADVVRALLHTFDLATAPGEEPPLLDAEIRYRLLMELADKRWWADSRVDVVVENGIVTLTGAVYDARVAQAFRVVAENGPGVREVRDHLVVAEGLPGWAGVDNAFVA